MGGAFSIFAANLIAPPYAIPRPRDGIFSRMFIMNKIIQEF